MDNVYFISRIYELILLNYHLMFKVNGFSIDIVDINILSYSFSFILILS